MYFGTYYTGLKFLELYYVYLLKVTIMLIHVGIISRVSAQPVLVSLVFVIVYFAYTGVQNEVRCLPILVSKTKSNGDLIIWIQKCPTYR